METKENLEQGFRTALGGFNELQNKFLNEALDQYYELIKQSISTDAGVITKQSLDIQQGFAVEAHHTGSYNIEAAGKGVNNHRATMDVGRRNDPVTDIRINTPDQNISSAFAQYHRLHAELQPLLKAANVAKGGCLSSRN
ncbi:hypothetical protein ACSFE6_00125 [Pseudomonas baetica]|uniref:hypothetical protein n=1 Tax=Pseudomonas baetica TaxID=674054 RepID=UPI003EED74DB